MTNVIPLASPRAGFQVQPSAPSPATPSQALEAIWSGQQVHNAISTYPPAAFPLRALPIGSAEPFQASANLHAG